jgi:hypothetical protein
MALFTRISFKFEEYESRFSVMKKTIYLALLALLLSHTAVAKPGGVVKVGIRGAVIGGMIDGSEGAKKGAIAGGVAGGIRRAQYNKRKRKIRREIERRTDYYYNSGGRGSLQDMGPWVR